MNDPQIPYRYGDHTGKTIGGKLASWLKVFFPARKKGPSDIAYLQAAEEKRENRRLRNLEQWAHDDNWHRECLTARTK